MIIYVQKKPDFDFLAQELLAKLQTLLVPHLEQIRLINAYLVENVSAEDLERARGIVFLEAQVDEYLPELDLNDCAGYFALQTLKGQLCPRSEAAQLALQVLNPSAPTPLVEHASIYKLYGNLSTEDIKSICTYLTNPLENHEIPLPLSQAQASMPTSPKLELANFANLSDFSHFIRQHQLCLSPEDLKIIQEQLPNLNLLELKILDTYWSDHCRHSTFLTKLEVHLDHPIAQEIYDQYLQVRQELGHNKPISLMDLSTIMAKYLSAQNKLPQLVQSSENNACTLSIKVQTPQGAKPYYLFFKNETHNHPTEIEPYGGASTCVGGAIRDVLSARGYVYAALRISGCGDPLEPIGKTRAGKLPQIKIAKQATQGFSSYGNQIGVATGLVQEVYHRGYKAKHLELGAVLGAAPQECVQSLEPAVGDLIVLLGGRTGRDGLGGASGSSQAHQIQSLELCGAQVQKGDALQERKLQRLFANPHFTKLIKRCNDLGAGGVSVAIPELASMGVIVQLDKMPIKYAGLSAFDLALSESQERMAILIDPKDLDMINKLCESEGVLSACVGQTTPSGYFELFYHQKRLAHIPITLLQSGGAPRLAHAHISQSAHLPKCVHSFTLSFEALALGLNTCSQKGLVSQFDSTIGSNTIFMPLGGAYQSTPIQVMAHTIPFEQTHTCSLVAFGFDPHACAQEPIKGGYFAVVTSVCKLIACGAQFKDIYLSFQEYFECLDSPSKWGKALGTLLGAFLAQKRLGIACIGGKDSMSGSFEDLSVPPTFISFAFCAQENQRLISPEFKGANHYLYLLTPPLDLHGLPYDFAELFTYLHALIVQEVILSASALGRKGAAQAILQMCLGNKIGVELEEVPLDLLFDPCFGGFVVECTQKLDRGILLGHTTAKAHIKRVSACLPLSTLLELLEQPLEQLYPTKAPKALDLHTPAKIFCDLPKSHTKIAKPRVLIPVFAGTNCEIDTQKAFERAGALVRSLVINTLTPESSTGSILAMRQALRESQILFLAGGFSGGDEPDGAAKMIKAFFSNPSLQEAILALLKHQDGLIGGICNGFQALLKTGLLPFGRSVPSQENHPTLLPNSLLRHQSQIAYIKVRSNRSPWLARTQVGEIYAVPISHGEGRFFAPPAMLGDLAQGDQIATQYVDLQGNIALETPFNPNGSLCGIEGITSACGRIFGKMGHTERFKPGLYQNVPGQFAMPIFQGAVDYYA
ncbi:phosphoribosylformylglycinamidine synthase [Helicobacter mehlei]|uniref:phosphoribosylformylglycinamidine synthase n=1 Tax=Helicobacter mehlei TaxID=2316080 RepID=UPI000EB051DC|nr:phosphoribosylformylglycinamidine synthase [Helicobacter mehlei]